MESSLSPNEIVMWLQEELGSPFRLLPALGGNRIVGRAQDDRFWLRYSTFYNNGPQRLLTFVIEPNCAGTKLRGEFRCSKLTLALSGLSFGFLLMFNVIWFAEIFEGKMTAHDGPQWMNFIPIGMLVFGGVLFRFGLWLSSLTEPRVIDFVERTLDARVVEIR